MLAQQPALNLTDRDGKIVNTYPYNAGYLGLSLADYNCFNFRRNDAHRSDSCKSAPQMITDLIKNGFMGVNSYTSSLAKPTFIAMNRVEAANWYVAGEYGQSLAIGLVKRQKSTEQKPLTFFHVQN
jgi:hypothetical protein